MSVEFHGVSHRYGAAQALVDVNLALAPGITALLGVNGAGKSTLLSLAAGILAPTAGHVTIDGRDLQARASRRDSLRKVNIMPQGATFPSTMPIEDIVAYLAWMKGFSSRDAMRQARASLRHVGLEDRLRTTYGSLSGGMARRVAFAQALATDPQVLLLDEPTTGLDPAQRRDMVERIRLLGDSGVTVLLSSHVVEDIADLARDVVVLHEGTMRYSGSVGGLAAMADPASRRSPIESGFFQSISGVGR